MKSRLLGAAALALAFVSNAASARDLPAGGFTINDVVQWLQSEGYQTQIVTDSDGTQHVSSMSSGVKFGVYMFDCKSDNRCASIQFAAGFATHGKFDTSHMNDWNRDQRWCRGYFDSENDPWVEYDVDLWPGGTYEGLDDEFGVWNKMLGVFVKKYSLQ